MDRPLPTRTDDGLDKLRAAVDTHRQVIEASKRVGAELREQPPPAPAVEIEQAAP